MRASGVISSHSARAALSAVRILRKSAGTSCTTPVAISFWAISEHAECRRQETEFRIGEPQLSALIYFSLNNDISEPLAK